MSTLQKTSRASLVDAWILISVFAQIAGWTLSVLGLLTPLAYGFCLLAAAAAVLVWANPFHKTLVISKLKWRFKHLLPALFAFTALLIFAGGAVHAPSNYDGLIYRTPRVLNWIADGQWHWIHSMKGNLNTRSTGFEWLSVPFFMFLKSDRALFLLNFLPYLMFPSLIVSILRGFHISPRAAWSWGWLLPAGYCYVLQAGSIGNDSFTGFYVFAAFHYAFRFRRSCKLRDFYFAWAAAALMTASKLPTLPLGGALLLLLFPGIKLAIRRPILSAGCFAAFILASFLPMAAMNRAHCGDWTGSKAEDPWFLKIEAKYALVSSVINFTLQNALPPVFLHGKELGSSIRSLFSEEHREGLIRNNESHEKIFNVAELQNEEDAGLGFGLTWSLIVLSAIGLWKGGAAKRPSRFPWLVYSAVWLALLTYMCRNGFSPIARYGAMFYPLLAALPIWLASRLALGRGHWKLIGAVAYVPALALVAITPSRPLFPAEAVFQKLQEMLPGNPILQRLRSGYAIYKNRPYGLQPVSKLLPPDESVIGYISVGESAETSLWKPFGTRKLLHIKKEDGVDYMRSRQIRYVVINDENFDAIFGLSVAEWAAKMGGEIVGEVDIQLKASNKPSRWMVVALSDLSPKPVLNT